MCCKCYRLFLVLVERQRPTASLENLSTARFQYAGIYQLSDIGSALVARIDLYEWLRPISFFGVDALNLRADVLGEDSRERGSEVLVLVNNAVAQ